MADFGGFKYLALICFALAALIRFRLAAVTPSSYSHAMAADSVPGNDVWKFLRKRWNLNHFSQYF